MITSRDLNELDAVVREQAYKLMSLCQKEDIQLLITCTYRDKEAQAALYAQGRTKPGNKVTKAKPGWSWHNWRLAFDVVPLRNGKPVWSTKGEDMKLWLKVGALGKQVGLEWGGDWENFKDYPHFQNTMGKTLKQLNAVKK